MGAGGGRRTRRAAARRTRQPYQADEPDEDDGGDIEDVIRREHEGLLIDQAVQELVALVASPSRPHAAFASACAVTGSLGVRCSTSCAWCSVARRSHSVVVIEVPNEPAVMRAKLNRPEAAGMRSGGRPDERERHQRDEEGRHARRPG